MRDKIYKPNYRVKYFYSKFIFNLQLSIILVRRDVSPHVWVGVPSAVSVAWTSAGLMPVLNFVVPWVFPWKLFLSKEWSDLSYSRMSAEIIVAPKKKIGPQYIHLGLAKLSSFDREGHKLKDLVCY